MKHCEQKRNWHVGVRPEPDVIVPVGEVECTCGLLMQRSIEKIKWFVAHNRFYNPSNLIVA